MRYNSSYCILLHFITIRITIFVVHHAFFYFFNPLVNMNMRFKNGMCVCVWYHKQQLQLKFYAFSENDRIKIIAWWAWKVTNLKKIDGFACYFRKNMCKDFKSNIMARKWCHTWWQWSSTIVTLILLLNNLCHRLIDVYFWKVTCPVMTKHRSLSHAHTHTIPFYWICLSALMCSLLI